MAAAMDQQDAAPPIAGTDNNDVVWPDVIDTASGKWGNSISDVINTMILHGRQLRPGFVSACLAIRKPLLASIEHDLEAHFLFFAFMLCARPNPELGNCGSMATATLNTTTSYTLHSRSIFGTPSCLRWEATRMPCTPRAVGR